MVPLTATARRVSGKGRTRTISVPAMFFKLSGIDSKEDLLVNLYLDGKKLVVVFSTQADSDVV